eukprot:COSAG02_NODE_1290_length_13442_cov_6.479125_9_plen_83_part_00
MHGMLVDARDEHSENYIRNGVWDGRNASVALEMHKVFVLSQLQEGCKRPRANSRAAREFSSGWRMTFLSTFFSTVLTTVQLY